MAQRDRIEKEFLDTAKERSAIVAQYDARLLELQSALEHSERDVNLHMRKPRQARWTPQWKPETVPLHCVSGSEIEAAMSHARLSTPDFGAISDDDLSALRARAARTMKLLVALLTHVSHDARNPRLVAYACLLAIGSEGLTMRQAARDTGVSANAVSLQARKIRRMFGLPGSSFWAKDNAHRKALSEARKANVNGGEVVTDTRPAIAKGALSIAVAKIVKSGKNVSRLKESFNGQRFVR